MTRRPLVPVLIACLAAACGIRRAAGDFIVKPYLQLGDLPKLSNEEGMSVLWHSADAERRWAVRYRVSRTAGWREARDISYRRVAVAGIEPHRVYHARLTGLTPGAGFEYDVLLDGARVFQASGSARKAASQPQRFVVIGDTAQATPGQREIAARVAAAAPDFLFITGDIVYGRGRISEYREKYFPVFNYETAHPEHGAPLLRSTLFLAAPGNHDLARDFSRHTDLLAYFLYWAQPLNGPAAVQAAELAGSADAIRRFREAAGPNYPRMANFSFDYGNAHWVVLDSMPYMDWTQPVLRDWLSADLQAAASATWKFVGFHHPGFNSSRAHFNEQRMRVLAPLFEEYGVDIVFAGHVHNYQRSYPMRFLPRQQNSGAHYRDNGNVGGAWTLDRVFDGAAKTKPNGVIYIVSGGGGARLYNPEQEKDPSSWQEFTARFSSTKHSLTQVDIDGSRLILRQIAADSSELDRVVVTR